MVTGMKLQLPGIFIILCLMYVVPGVVDAETITYELTIAEEKITIAGESAEGMTINGGIPGPTLHFREGDKARIHVHNRMSVPTSIHWHGLLVPPNMDGVPLLSFPPIQPGATFTYEFPIRQHGTYWYHSHSNLQEQSGVYGSIVIEPRENQPIGDSDHVVLLSDWTTENPHGVLRTLKRGSEWYALKKGSSQSIVGAARIGHLGDYFTREFQRMPAMDIADVAYDHFLANGQPENTLSASGGSLVRLRLINGSATTYFYVEYAGGPMTIISADGLDVQPVEQQRFLIGVAETYDVLIKTPRDGAYEFRATAHDASGYATTWIGSGQRHAAPAVPPPNLYQGMRHGSQGAVWSLTPSGVMGMPDSQVASGDFDRPGMMGMEGSSMGQGHMMGHGGHTDPGPQHAASEKMPAHNGHEMQGEAMIETHAMQTVEKTDHTMHDMPSMPQAESKGKKYATDFRPLASDVSSRKDLASDGMDPSRPWPPYSKLRSMQPTLFDPGKPVREIRFTLDGDMQRYVWLLNNKTLSESDVIRIREGEVVRFIMINRTMMHHPMHLHGHFFRVLNGQGDFAPLKHTVDVAPMSTTVIEFYSNEVGDWFFHCHLLYHMKSGMARVVHYEGYKPDQQTAAIRDRLFEESWYAWGEADVLSNMTEGALTVADTRNMFEASWEVGWQDVDKTDWEGLLTYDRSFNRFFSVFGGIDSNGAGSDEEKTRGVLGLRYLLPLNVESRVWVDSDRGARVILDKEFTLTPRLALIGEVKYDTHDKWDGKAGLSYILAKNVSLLGQWHSEYGWGGGLKVRF